MRKTSKEIQEEINGLKSYALKSIEELIEEKEITHIELANDYQVATAFVSQYAYYMIGAISKDGVWEHDEGLDRLNEITPFSELSLDNAVYILSLLEGDISKIVDDEDEDEDDE
jgi:hypothetical protein